MAGGHGGGDRRARRRSRLWPGGDQPADGRRGGERQVAVGGHRRSRSGGADGRCLFASPRRPARRLRRGARSGLLAPAALSSRSCWRRSSPQRWSPPSMWRSGWSSIPATRTSPSPRLPAPSSRSPSWLSPSAGASLKPGAAEIAAAGVLAGSALFVVVNEGIANWQALLLAGPACAARAYRIAGEGRARLSTSSAIASAEARVL